MFSFVWSHFNVFAEDMNEDDRREYAVGVALRDRRPVIYL